jgi:hypothetical protein
MSANHQEIILQRANLLVRRLERLSADSVWAHRASGIRASLDKILASDEEIDPDRLDALVETGFDLLHKAARELRSE